MLFIINWTGLHGHTYTRDFSDSEVLHTFIGTLLLNGFEFKVMKCRK